MEQSFSEYTSHVTLTMNIATNFLYDSLVHGVAPSHSYQGWLQMVDWLRRHHPDTQYRQADTEIQPNYLG